MTARSISFTASRVLSPRAAEGVVTNVLTVHVPYADRYLTGACTGGDAFIGRWLRLRRPDAEHVVIVPADHSRVDPWWEQTGCPPVTVTEMPPGSTYADRNARLVEEAGAVFAFPAYPERDPRSLRSGTWQTVRMARKAGNFSQWHCVKPPYRGMIEEWPRDLLGDGVLADDPACERPRAVASGMTLSLAEHAKHVDTILRGSSLTPDAQVSLRVVLAEQNLCTEACLAMFHHLAGAGNGGWSAQWAFINDKLKSVGYPPAD